jgi:hypothetical protein
MTWEDGSTWFTIAGDGGGPSNDFRFSACEDVPMTAPGFLAAPTALSASNVAVYLDPFQTGTMLTSTGTGTTSTYTYTQAGTATYLRVGGQIDITVPMSYDINTGNPLRNRSGTFTAHFRLSSTLPLVFNSWGDSFWSGFGECALVSCGSSSGTTTTTTAPPPIPSNACDSGGTNVTDGTIEGTYAKLKVKSPSPSEHWICYRLDNSGANLHKGGRLRIGGSGGGVTGTPVVDQNSAYCATQAGNVVSVNTTVGPTNAPVRLDRYDNANEAGVCLRVDAVRARVSVPKAPSAGIPAAHDEDSS